MVFSNLLESFLLTLILWQRIFQPPNAERKRKPSEYCKVTTFADADGGNRTRAAAPHQRSKWELPCCHSFCCEGPGVRWMSEAVETFWKRDETSLNRKTTFWIKISFLVQTKVNGFFEVHPHLILIHDAFDDRRTNWTGATTKVRTASKRIELENEVFLLKFKMNLVLVWFVSSTKVLLPTVDRPNINYCQCDC